MRVPDSFRPLALIATYNDLDIAPQIVAKLTDDLVEVHIIDNWSTDGTFEYFAALAAGREGVSVERFPQHGPTTYFEWGAILARKEEIAAHHRSRWIIHQDSDEVRRSPWADISLRCGLFVADLEGFNAIMFTRYEFVPTDDSFAQGTDPEVHFRYCRTLNGHLPPQLKAWRQPATRVELAASGGHEVRFAGRKVYPHPFVLKHYSLRNNEQARRKIFVERLGRYSPAERASGWHAHYDHLTRTDTFIHNPSQCIEYVDRPLRGSTDSLPRPPE